MSHTGKHIAAIRKDYQLAVLDKQVAGDDPFAFFHKWFAEAQQADAEEVNAMTLATVNAAGKPHARIVLLKGLDDKGFVFYTNYNSEKGRDIAENPNVSLVFFWKELERQVCIEGIAEKVSGAESDEYFHSRPAGSRIGAWSSPQSTVIPNRDILEENYKQYTEQYGDNAPRPEHWGGYRIIPSSIEFWQGRSSRMHDRILFSRNADGAWQKCRLAP